MNLLRKNKNDTTIYQHGGVATSRDTGKKTVDTKSEGVKKPSHTTQLSEEKRKEIKIKRDKVGSQNDDDDSQSTVPMPIRGLKIKQDETHSISSTFNPNEKQAKGTNIHQSNVDTGDNISSSSSNFSFSSTPSGTKESVNPSPPYESLSSIHKSGPKVTEKINYKQFIEIAKNKTDTLLGNHDFENFFFEVPI